ncbi:MAG: 3-phosphoglycerate dehydrogenase, partial [Planctomycetaceae bacterium]
MPKVVITAKIAKEGPHNKIFQDHGFDVVYPAQGCDVFQEDQLIGVLQGADAVLAGSEPYSPRAIEALPQLRTITRAGVGYDAVNLEA